MPIKARDVKSRRLKRPTANDNRARPTTTDGQGSHFNALSMLTSAWVTAVLRPSNSQSPSMVIQLTTSSIAPPVTSRTDRSRLMEPSLESSRDTVVGNSISGPQISRLTSSTTTTAAAPMDQRYMGVRAGSALRGREVSALD